MQAKAQVAEIDSDHPLIRGYFGLLGWLNCGAKIVGGALLVLMSVAVFSSVVSRSVANLSLAWVEEAAVFIMVWVVVFGTALAIEAKHMIAVEALAVRFPRTARKVLKTGVGIVSMVFIVILISAGWDMANIAEIQYSPTLPWFSMFWVYLSMPVGGVFMLLNLVGNVIKIWTQAVEQESEILE